MNINIKMVKLKNELKRVQLDISNCTTLKEEMELFSIKSEIEAEIEMLIHNNIVYMKHHYSNSNISL